MIRFARLNKRAKGTELMLSPDQLRIVRETIADLLSVVSSYQAAERPEQKGVWFCLRDRNGGDETMVHEEVGNVGDDEAKRLKYKRVSRTKVAMVFGSGCETSWETRSADPEKELFGGGVALLDQELDGSISGFPEEADTAGILYSLCRAGACSRATAFRIAQKAPGAPIWLRIFEIELGLLAA